MALHRSNTPCQRMQSGPVHFSLKTLTWKRPKDQAWAGCISFLSTDDGAVRLTSFARQLGHDGPRIPRAVSSRLSNDLMEWLFEVFTLPRASFCTPRQRPIMFLMFGLRCRFPREFEESGLPCPGTLRRDCSQKTAELWSRKRTAIRSKIRGRCARRLRKKSQLLSRLENLLQMLFHILDFAFGFRGRCRGRPPAVLGARGPIGDTSGIGIFRPLYGWGV